jgi:alpha-tubulin suppressor-like RCC1 family protein
MRRLAAAVAPAVVLLVALAAPAGGQAAVTPYSWGVFGSRGAVSPIQDSPVAISGIPGTIVQVSASNSDTYFLTSIGKVWAIGADQYGELGNGATVNSFTKPVSVQFPLGVTIKALPSPMPYDTGLAIDSRGNAWGWGVDNGGELCLGAATEELKPVELPLHGVTLAAGAGHHAVYDASGVVSSCGDNSTDALGSGNQKSALTPVPVIGLPASVAVAALTSSYGSAGALLADGSYWNWGLNNLGQLGIGTTQNSEVAKKVTLGASVTQVFEGGSSTTNGQTLAELSTGEVVGWGADQYGQLCSGTTPARVTEPEQIVPPSGVTWSFVTSAGATSYAIDSAGNLWGCGTNANGELGLGTRKSPLVNPKKIMAGVVQISATAHNAGALAG